VRALLRASRGYFARLCQPGRTGKQTLPRTPEPGAQTKVGMVFLPRDPAEWGLRFGQIADGDRRQARPSGSHPALLRVADVHQAVPGERHPQPPHPGRMLPVDAIHRVGYLLFRE